MTKTRPSNSDGTLVGLAFLAYVAMCGATSGGVMAPIAFFIWVFIGKMISCLIANTLVIGDKPVKESAALVIYFLGLALISLLAVI